MNESLPGVFQTNGAQPRSFLVPASALLHIEKQMHLALEQRRKLRTCARADCLDPLATLTDQDRYKIYEGNARRVFPRLDTALKAKGK